MSREFIAPSFIQENDAQTIQKRMMDLLPSDIDNMPGGFPWDFTMPTAIEKSEMIQFHLVQTLMLMFPMWAWGEWLDYHAAAQAISRREAGYARGYLLIKGEPETVILKGTVFATAATDDGPSIEFESTETQVIDESGELKLNIVAKAAGKESNVAKGTIVLMAKPVEGIDTVVNPENMTGGTDIEDDESLRERVHDAYKAVTVSFVGSDSDYIRWAKEIIGVGSVIVIPENDGPGTVKLVIIDPNGEPANDQIIKDVYDYIVAPDDRLKRLAPIGAQVTVVKPTMIGMHYECQAILHDGFTDEMIAEAFKSEIQKYYDTAKDEKVLKYHRLVSIMAQIEGIDDIEEFKVNGDTVNVALKDDEYPRTESVNVEAI